MLTGRAVLTRAFCPITGLWWACSGYSHRWTVLSASVPDHSNTSREHPGGSWWWCSQEESLNHSSCDIPFRKHTAITSVRATAGNRLSSTQPRVMPVGLQSVWKASIPPRVTALRWWMRRCQSSRRSLERFTFSCCLPDARKQAQGLQAPGVCVWCSRFEFLAFIYLRQPALSPVYIPPTLDPSHRTPSQRHTQARSLKLIHGVNVIFLPDFLCVSLSPPIPANQSPEAKRVWAALSPVRTGRGWRAHSRPSSLGCCSNFTTPPSLVGSVLLSLSLLITWVTQLCSFCGSWWGRMRLPAVFLAPCC